MMQATRILSGFRPRILAPCSLLILLFSSGCFIFPLYPESYGYVLKMADPSRMTEWTLKQTQERQISDGMLALSRVHNRQPENEKAIAMAGEGFLRIHAKLTAGWPGFCGDPRLPPEDRFGDLPEEFDARHLESTVRFSYVVATNFGGDVFEKIKPRPEEKARLAAWLDAEREAGWSKPRRSN